MDAHNMWEKILKNTYEEDLELRNTDLSKVNDAVLEILYNECKTQLNIQYQSIQSILNRSGILVGFIGLILATLIGLEKNSVTMVFLGGLIFLGISFLATGQGLISYRSLSPWIVSQTF